MRRRTSGLAALAAFVFVPAASAVPPRLGSVTAPQRHPAAAFAAPKAGALTISFATKPDRASDGTFVSDNVAELEDLTAAEIKSGRWVFERQIEPGTYYVMLSASPDFAQCYLVAGGTYDPACADGFSNVVRLIVPKPVTRYDAGVNALPIVGTAYLWLAGDPLGERRSYKVCYQNKNGRRSCVSRTLDGDDWDARVQDNFKISARTLRTITTFSWYVDGVLVARKTARMHL
jgi:hypothetical protein